MSVDSYVCKYRCNYFMNFKNFDFKDSLVMYIFWALVRYNMKLETIITLFVIYLKIYSIRRRGG